MAPKHLTDPSRYIRKWYRFISAKHFPPHPLRFLVLCLLQPAIQNTLKRPGKLWLFRLFLVVINGLHLFGYKSKGSSVVQGVVELNDEELAMRAL